MPFRIIVLMNSTLYVHLQLAKGNDNERPTMLGIDKIIKMKIMDMKDKTE